MIIIHEYHMMTDDDNINNNINNINNINNNKFAYLAVWNRMHLASIIVVSIRRVVCVRLWIAVQCDSIRFCSDRGLSALLFRRALSKFLLPALRLQLRLNRSPAYHSVTDDDHLWHGQHILSRHVQLSNSGSEHAYSQSWSSKKEGPDSFRFFKWPSFATRCPRRTSRPATCLVDAPGWKIHVGVPRILQQVRISTPFRDSWHRNRTLSAALARF